MIDRDKITFSNLQNLVKNHKNFIFCLLGFYSFTVIFIILNYDTLACDRDEAILLSIRALFRGEFHFDQLTSLGMPVGGGGRFPMNFLIFIPFYLIFGFNNMTIYAMRLFLPTIVLILLYRRFYRTHKKSVFIFIILWTFTYWWLFGTFWDFDLYLPILLGCLAIFYLPEQIPILSYEKEQFKNKFNLYFQKFFPKKENQLKESKYTYLSFILAAISFAMRIYCFIFPLIVLLYNLRSYGFKTCIKGLGATILIIGGSILPFFLMDPIVFLEIVLYNTTFYSEWMWVVFSILLPYGSYNASIIAGICFFVVLIQSFRMKNRLSAMTNALVGFGILYFFICFSNIYFVDYLSWIAIPILFVLLLYNTDRKNK